MAINELYSGRSTSELDLPVDWTPLGSYFTCAANHSYMWNRLQNKPEQADKRLDLLTCFPSLIEVNLKSLPVIKLTSMEAVYIWTLR